MATVLPDFLGSTGGEVPRDLAVGVAGSPDVMPMSPIAPISPMAQPVGTYTPVSGYQTPEQTGVSATGQRLSDTDVALSRLKKVQAEGEGFMPHFLATMAALNGNFGPAIQLREQKRKTQLAINSLPVYTKIREFTNQGKFDEALDLAQQAGSVLTGRAPEIAQMYQKLGDVIATKQDNVQQTKALYDLMKTNMEGLGKNDPRQKQLAAVKYALDTNQPLDKETRNEILRQFRLHVQAVEGQILRVSESTGQAAPPEALPQFAGVSAMREPLIATTAAAHKLDPAQLANVINGVTATGLDGRKIEPGSPEALAIRGSYGLMLPQQAMGEMGKTVPIGPEIVAELLRQGLTPQQIYTRQTQAGMDSAIAMDALRKGAVAYQTGAAGIQAQQQTATTAFGPAGQVIIDMRPESPTHGLPVANVSQAQINASGGKLHPVLADNYYQIMRPATSAIQGLDRARDLVQAIGNVNTPIGQLSQSIRERISTFIGAPVDNEVLARAVVGTILSDAIEQVNSIPGAKNAATGRLKEFVLGPAGSTDDLLKAITYLQDRLKEVYKTAAGAGSLSSEPPSSPPTRTQGGVGKQGFTPESPTSTYTGKGRPGQRQQLLDTLDQQGTEPAPTPSAQPQWKPDFKRAR